MNTLSALLLTLALAMPAWAAPGAHGPNGEHLDGQGASTTSTDSTPRFETFSEQFELVATLSGNELSVLIDRYETNEPLVNGKLELEFNGIKVNAKPQPDVGGYLFDEPKLIKALAEPGRHSLLFMVVAGEESDLLDGTLVVNAAQAQGHEHGAGEDHGHGHDGMRGLLLGGGAILILITVTAIHTARRRKIASGK